MLRQLAPGSTCWLCAVSGLLGLAIASGCSGEVVVDTFADDPARYIEEVDYRRGVLERDLTERDNDYARTRLELYALDREGWELLPEADPPTRALLVAELESLQRGEALVIEPAHASTLVPDAPPVDEAAWIDLGRRVFFEYPLRPEPVYEALVQLPDALAQVGFLFDQGAVVGLRVMQDETGAARIGTTCAQCHASPDAGGGVSGVLSNRAMDVGAARLLSLGLTPGELPLEIDSTQIRDLDRLGPGRNDVLADGVFNPYAFPDFGGIVDVPYLHHNANWLHGGAATLAIRCETLFITSSGERTRIPRVLSWALAMYFRSLAAPPPLDATPLPEAARGEEVFAEQGCAGCHTPPLYTSDREVWLDMIGTDRAAPGSTSRGTGHVRIPSLRGVGRAAPYLHHGAVDSLEQMFDPGREEPGHPFGLELSPADREALIAFLRSI